GKVGTAFALDGVDDYIEIASSPSLRITDALTIETWVRIDSAGGAPQHYVLDTRDGTGGGFGLNVDTDLIQFFWEGRPDVDYPSTIQVGMWHHVAGTYDGSITRVYVDGAEVGSIAVSGAIPVSSGSAYIGQRFTFTE